MDDVERMYRQLVRIIRATSPQLLTQPFPVSDLYSTILPYRLHRRELGLETNQDYEMAMLELLSGGRGYLLVDDRMRQTLGDSLKSPNPDPALIRQFGDARVALAPDPLRQLDGDGQSAAAAPTAGADAATIATAPAGTSIKEPSSPSSRTTAGLTTTAQTSPVAGTARDNGATTAGRSTGTTASAPSTATRRPARPITVSPAGEECPHCKGQLPTGRPINFCPHCGQDLTVHHCPACGSELEHEWKFCVTCGRAVGTG
jgi:hypothetical protein